MKIRYILYGTLSLGLMHTALGMQKRHVLTEVKAKQEVKQEVKTEQDKEINILDPRNIHLLPRFAQGARVHAFIDFITEHPETLSLDYMQARLHQVYKQIFIEKQHVAEMSNVRCTALANAYSKSSVSQATRQEQIPVQTVLQQDKNHTLSEYKNVVSVLNKLKNRSVSNIIFPEIDWEKEYAVHTQQHPEHIGLLYKNYPNTDTLNVESLSRPHNIINALFNFRQKLTNTVQSLKNQKLDDLSLAKAADTWLDTSALAKSYEAQTVNIIELACQVLRKEQLAGGNLLAALQLNAIKIIGSDKKHLNTFVQNLNNYYFDMQGNQLANLDRAKRQRVLESFAVLLRNWSIDETEYKKYVQACVNIGVDDIPLCTEAELATLTNNLPEIVQENRARLSSNDQESLKAASSKAILSNQCNAPFLFLAHKCNQNPLSKEFLPDWYVAQDRLDHYLADAHLTTTQKEQLVAIYNAYYNQTFDESGMARLFAQNPKWDELSYDEQEAIKDDPSLLAYWYDVLRANHDEFLANFRNKFSQQAELDYYQYANHHRLQQSTVELQERRIENVVRTSSHLQGHNEDHLSRRRMSNEQKEQDSLSANRPPSTHGQMNPIGFQQSVNRPQEYQIRNLAYTVPGSQRYNTTSMMGNENTENFIGSNSTQNRITLLSYTAPCNNAYSSILSGQQSALTQADSSLSLLYALDFEAAFSNNQVGEVDFILATAEGNTRIKQGTFKITGIMNGRLPIASVEKLDVLWKGFQQAVVNSSILEWRRPKHEVWYIPCPDTRHGNVIFAQPTQAPRESHNRTPSNASIVLHFEYIPCIKADTLPIKNSSGLPANRRLTPAPVAQLFNPGYSPSQDSIFGSNSPQLAPGQRVFIPEALLDRSDPKSFTHTRIEGNPNQTINPSPSAASKQPTQSSLPRTVKPSASVPVAQAALSSATHYSAAQTPQGVALSQPNSQQASNAAPAQNSPHDTGRPNTVFNILHNNRTNNHTTGNASQSTETTPAPASAQAQVQQPALAQQAAPNYDTILAVSRVNNKVVNGARVRRKVSSEQQSALAPSYQRPVQSPVAKAPAPKAPSVQSNVPIASLSSLPENMHHRQLHHLTDQEVFSLYSSDPRFKNRPGVAERLATILQGSDLSLIRTLIPALSDNDFTLNFELLRDKFTDPASTVYLENHLAVIENLQHYEWRSDLSTLAKQKIAQLIPAIKEQAARINKDAQFISDYSRQANRTAEQQAHLFKLYRKTTKNSLYKQRLNVCQSALTNLHRQVSNIMHERLKNYKKDYYSNDKVVALTLEAEQLCKVYQPFKNLLLRDGLSEYREIAREAKAISEEIIGVPYETLDYIYSDLHIPSNELCVIYTNSDQKEMHSTILRSLGDELIEPDLQKTLVGLGRGALNLNQKGHLEQAQATLDCTQVLKGAFYHTLQEAAEWVGFWGAGKLSQKIGQRQVAQRLAASLVTKVGPRLFSAPLALVFTVGSLFINVYQNASALNEDYQQIKQAWLNSDSKSLGKHLAKAGFDLFYASKVAKSLANLAKQTVTPQNIEECAQAFKEGTQNKKWAPHTPEQRLKVQDFKTAISELKNHHSKEAVDKAIEILRLNDSNNIVANENCLEKVTALVKALPHLQTDPRKVFEILEINKDICDLNKLEEAIKLCRHIPNLLESDSPFTKLLKTASSNVPGDYNTFRGALYEIETAVKLLKSGKQIRAFSFKSGGIEFDVLTNDILIECKNILWENMDQLKIGRMRQGFVSQKRISNDLGLPFIVYSKRKITVEWKSWFNNKGISFIED